MSLRMFLVATLSFLIVISIPQNAHAVITSVTIEPQCGPSGTQVVLTVRFLEGSKVEVEFSPDVEAGGDVGDTAQGYYFRVPDGVDRITITIKEDGTPVRMLTFTRCGTVGGYVIPVNKFEILLPYLTLAGLFAVISVAVVVRKIKKT